MEKYSGLKYLKFDLHVHTPASFDFINKAVTSEQIVSQAIKVGIRAIAITDHNTGDWIDKIKETAKKKNLTIFPGVEIHCSGGESGIHVIGLLDVDKGTKHISGILSSLKIDPDNFGKKTTVTHESVYKVIEVITSKPYNGIAILAHCTSSKGVLSDIKGEIRTEIFKHSGLLAVESSNNDFKNKDKTLKKTRAIDLLDGNNENFNFRKLGVYIASDSNDEKTEGHTLEGIGSKYTFFKVDDIINLESLRQCFIDRDVRIRQSFELKTNVYPIVKEIKVSGGFFDKQEAGFHNGLNSILGSKGAGKSLLIELLRFSLNKTSSQEEIYQDHLSKLIKRLQTYGKVEVTIVDETGMQHTLQRTFNQARNSPYHLPEQESVANSFKCIFLSQNEIIKIAEDENEQINFIDSFFDFQYYRNSISNLEKDLTQMDISLADGLKAFSDLTEIQNQLTNAIKSKEKLDKLLSDKIYDNYKVLEEKDNAISKQLNFANGLIAKLESYLPEIDENEVPVFKEKFLQEDPVIRRNIDSINEAVREAKSFLQQGIEEVKKIILKILGEKTNWTKTFQIEKNKYESHIRNTGGDRKTQEAKRIKLTKEIDELTKRRDLLNKKKENIKNIITERNSKIDELFKIYEEYSEERKAKCLKFETESDGKLKINIQESTNFEEFRNNLLQLKRGSYIQGSDIDTICAKITPRHFIANLFNYEVSKQEEKLKPIEEITKVGLDKVKTLCDFLLSQVDYRSLLSLQYKAKPQDRPEIKFKVNASEYELLKDISVGQKCTAMLMMTLSEGKFPVIIDQPEDSLDVRTVWEDMCLKVRKGKENRQFIFTTHNSSLAVASDTDKFTIIESDSSTGKIMYSGAIDSMSIKEEVIKYLEGGRPTYSHKANKYDINK